MPVTPEQQAAIDSVRAMMAQQAEPQRLRTMAQGATFNMADEAEAAARSAISGRPRQEIEQEIRQGLRSYQQASPMSSAAYEFAGAVVPAAAATIATRNPAPATGIFTRFFPNLA